jgi:hypothetical protein
MDLENTSTSLHTIENCRKMEYQRWFNDLCKEHILEDMPSFDKETLGYYLIKCVRQIDNIEIFKKLIECGTDINSADEKNRTSLYFACFFWKL